MYDKESLLSQRSLSTRRLASSFEAGWTSALLERHQCEETRRSFEGHPTPDLHLVVQVGGKHELEVLKNGRWQLGRYFAGSVGMRAAWETERMRSTCEAPFQIAHLYIPHGVLTENAERLRRAGQRTKAQPISALVFQDPVISGTVGALLSALSGGVFDLYVEQAVQWLSTHLLTTHGNYRAFDRSTAGCISDVRLARAVSMIKERYGDQLSLDDLSREAGVSKYHFSRLFKEKTGKSPYAFLLAERMASARQLLAQSDLLIAEIAQRTGFASTAQFSTVFRRAHRMTPRSYRFQEQGLRGADREVEQRGSQ